MTTTHEQFCIAARDRIPYVLQTIGYPAQRYTTRESTDFLGRINAAIGEVEDIFDEFPNSDVIDHDQADRLHEAFIDLAALAAAQIALIEVQHPHVLDDEQ